VKKFRSHKEVHAMKIEEIEIHGEAEQDNDHVLIGGTPREAVEVSLAYMARHNPQVGGYYVKYEDGYESFSPAEAFESGYTEIQ